MSKKKIKPLARPGFTMFNNYILDHIMPAISHTGWKVLCVVIRYTIGWEDKSTESGRKEKDRIAYSQFRKGTGIKSLTTLSKAIQENLNQGYLLRKVSCEHAQQFDYFLNQDYEAEIETYPENGQDVGTYPENGQVIPETYPENGYTKETLKETVGEKNISPIGDFNFLTPVGRGEHDPDFPIEEKEDKQYKPGPGKIVSCVDPDTDEEVGEPDWRFPQTQIQHQAFNITGRKRFRTRTEHNKMRKIEYKLENGELPHEFWEAQKGCARKYSWNFPVLLKSTLNPDRFREWQAQQ